MCELNMQCDDKQKTDNYAVAKQTSHISFQWYETDNVISKISCSAVLCTQLLTPLGSLNDTNLYYKSTDCMIRITTTNLLRTSSLKVIELILINCERNKIILETHSH